MFIIDPQTINDLQIFPINKNGEAIFTLFNSKVKTYGGHIKLETMFRNPLTSEQEIDDRLNLIEFLSREEISIEIGRETLDFIEYYMSTTTIPIPTRISYINGIRRAVSNLIREKNEYYIIKRGLLFIADILKDLYAFATQYENSQSLMLAKFANRILTILGSDKLFMSMVHFKRSKMSTYEIVDFDNLIRYKARTNFRELLDILYQLEVYTSLADIINKSNFNLPKRSNNESGISIQGLFHPLLTDPVDNDIYFNAAENICFITGANMSGKSTFMKSFGIASLLAHMGFPVPAKEMTFEMFNGILTTINLSDNLSLGYSHFYSEVQRIKSVAKHIGNNNRLIILFDELFRGTNVKDAHDGTVAIIDAFAKKRDSLFIFSTHITEVAQELKELKHINFQSFNSELIENRLSYRYKLEKGISQERLGMYIIEQEGLISLIENGIKSPR